MVVMGEKDNRTRERRIKLLREEGILVISA